MSGTAHLHRPWCRKKMPHAARRTMLHNHAKAPLPVTCPISPDFNSSAALSFQGAASKCRARLRRKRHLVRAFSSYERLEGVVQTINRIISVGESQRLSKPKSAKELLKQQEARKHRSKKVTLKAQCKVPRLVQEPASGVRPLHSYLSLPVEEYSLLDPAWIQRDPIHANSFLLTIPLQDLMGLDLQPKIRVTASVDTDKGQVAITADSFTLGDPRLDSEFDMQLHTVLSCATATKADIQQLPPPPSYSPPTSPTSNRTHDPNNPFTTNTTPTAAADTSATLTSPLSLPETSATVTRPPSLLDTSATLSSPPSLPETSATLTQPPSLLASKPANPQMLTLDPQATSRDLQPLSPSPAVPIQSPPSQHAAHTTSSTPFTASQAIPQSEPTHPLGVMHSDVQTNPAATPTPASDAPHHIGNHTPSLSAAATVADTAHTPAALSTEQTTMNARAERESAVSTPESSPASAGNAPRLATTPRDTTSSSLSTACAPVETNSQPTPAVMPHSRVPSSHLSEPPPVTVTEPPPVTALTVQSSSGGAVVQEAQQVVALGPMAKICGDVRMSLTINMPPPLAIVPGPLLQYAGGTIMKLSLQALLPGFLELLAMDYTRWAAGQLSRSDTAGSLLGQSQTNLAAPQTATAADPQQPVEPSHIK